MNFSGQLAFRLRRRITNILVRWRPWRPSWKLIGTGLAFYLKVTLIRPFMFNWLLGSNGEVQIAFLDGGPDSHH